MDHLLFRLRFQCNSSTPNPTFCSCCRIFKRPRKGAGGSPLRPLSCAQAQVRPYAHSGELSGTGHSHGRSNDDRACHAKDSRPVPSLRRQDTTHDSLASLPLNGLAATGSFRPRAEGDEPDQLLHLLHGSALPILVLLSGDEVLLPIHEVAMHPLVERDNLHRRSILPPDVFAVFTQHAPRCTTVTAYYY